MRRREPFVWLSDQPFDHAAGFATLRGGPLRREREGVNRWIFARGRFEVAEEDKARLRLTVDGRYRAWLDGRHLGRGPGRSNPDFQRFDEYEFPLAAGVHCFALLIHVPGVDLAWYQRMQGGWQPVFGDGGLWAELEIGNDPTNIAWRVEPATAWRRDTVRSGWGQDFIEDVDARRIPENWTDVGFDDSGWLPARPMVSIGDEAARSRGFGRVEPFPALIPGGLPQPDERPIGPQRLVWARRVEQARDEGPVETSLYRACLGEDAADLLNQPGGLISGDGAIVRSEVDGATALMLSFEPYHAGRPFIDVEAVGGEIIEVAVGESLPGEFGVGEPGDGLRLEGHLGVAHVFRYTARAGSQRFEKFNFAGFRAMQIVVRNAPAGVRLRVGSIATNYTTSEEGHFACSDPILDQLWVTGRHTVRQCMQDSWIDCPGREGRQWVGDALVAFDVATLAFGPTVYPLHRQFLTQMAESQRSDGLVRMFAPGDIAAEALVIPDFTLLWMITAHRYWLETGDQATITEIFPAIMRAAAWLDRHVGPNGLLADVPHWHFIEWADVGREGESAPINALMIGALTGAARLADVIGWSAQGDRLRARAACATGSLNERHWDVERRVYVDSVDVESGKRGRRVSQHANALILLFGIAPIERRERIAAAITDSRRLKLTAAPPIVPSGEPFDEETDVVRANTFYSHFVYSALAGADRFDWVLEDIRSLYGPMLATGTTTLWESFAPNASLCHGFSATPVHQLSRHVLGISPASPAYGHFTIDPQPGDLIWARGDVPTPSGPIHVEWEKVNSMLRLRLDHPQQCLPALSKAALDKLVSRVDRTNGVDLELRL